MPATRYLSESAFEERFTADELAGLQAEGAVLVRAVEDASALIDLYVGAAYALPLAIVPVPAMLISWCSDIARFRLWKERATPEVRQRYEDALAQLQLLAAGTIKLPIAVGTGEFPVAVTVYAPPRVFDDEGLYGFLGPGAGHARKGWGDC